MKTNLRWVGVVCLLVSLLALALMLASFPSIASTPEWPASRLIRLHFSRQ